MIKQKENLDKLWEFISWCYHDLNEFDSIFPDNQLQFDLLNDVAPSFFSHLNELYFNSFFLSMAKLFDPSKQFGNSNLSIKVLIEICDDLNLNIKQEITEKIDLIEKDIKHIIDYRKKYLAHNDLSFAFGIFKIDKVTKIEDIRATFDKILELINILYKQMGEQVKHPDLLRDFKGADSLIRVLKEWSVYKDVAHLSDNLDLYNKAFIENKYKDL